MANLSAIELAKKKRIRISTNFKKKVEKQTTIIKKKKKQIVGLIFLFD